MTIRPATNDDREEIQSLVFGILRSFGLEPSPDSTDADLSDIEAHYHRAGGAFDVLVDESGEIVGTVAIHRTDGELCELRKMYLSEECRGRGLGRRLLEHSLERARELGFRRVWLETAKCLRDAHRLYESYGFTPYEAPHQSDRCDFAMAMVIATEPRD